MPNIKAIQIDFDATVSERDFYKNLITELKKQLPENVPLTTTALASWCADDDWLAGLPVDEAVPMIFEMGADDKAIRDFLAKGNDWQEPLCRSSYGVSITEPLNIKFKPNRKFFIFNSAPRGWRADDLVNLPEGILR